MASTQEQERRREAVFQCHEREGHEKAKEEMK